MLVDKVRSTVTEAQKLRCYAPLYLTLWFSTDLKPLRGRGTLGK